MNLAGIEFVDRDLVERVMRNITRPGKGVHCSPRWAVVRNTFGVGSCVAWDLCREFELDPEEILK